METGISGLGTAPWVEDIGGETYEIGQLLGTGHMVTVHAGVRRRDGRDVAIKFLKDWSLAARLSEEQAILRQLANRHRQRCVVAGVTMPLYVPEVFGVRAEGPRPCIVVERVTGEPLGAIDASWCQEHQMPREWVAVKVGRQFAQILDDLRAMQRSYPDLKDNCLVWCFDQQDRRGSHIVIIDWNLLGDLSDGDAAGLVERNLAELNLLVYQVAVGRTLRGLGTPDYDALENTGGEGWQALTYGMKELLARALSPLKGERFGTAAELAKAYEEHERYWDEADAGHWYGAPSAALGWPGDQTEEELRRTATLRGIARLRSLPGADPKAEREAIAQLEQKQGLGRVALQFEAGRDDVETLVQGLLTRGRHVLHACRWQQVLHGMDWRSLQPPERKELLELLEFLAARAHDKAHSRLELLARAQPGWRLDALREECRFATSMARGAALGHLDLAGAELAYRTAAEAYRQLAGHDDQYAAQLMRLYGDPEERVRAIAEQRERNQAEATLREAAAAKDAHAARRLFLQALRQGAAPAAVASEIERWADRLLQHNPDNLSEALVLTSLAIQDERMRSLQWSHRLLTLCHKLKQPWNGTNSDSAAALSSFLVTLTELEDHLSQAAPPADADAPLAAFGHDCLRKQRGQRDDLLSRASDETLAQVSALAQAYSAEDRQALNALRTHRERARQEETAALRSASRSYWEAVSRRAAELGLDQQAAERYLHQFDQAYAREALRDAWAANVRDRLTRALEYAQRMGSRLRDLHDVEEGLRQGRVNYDDAECKLQALAAPADPDSDLQARAAAALRRVRESKMLQERIRDLQAVRSLLTETHKRLGTYRSEDLLSWGVELAKELSASTSDPEVYATLEWFQRAERQIQMRSGSGTTAPAAKYMGTDTWPTAQRPRAYEPPGCEHRYPLPKEMPDGREEGRRLPASERPRTLRRAYVGLLAAVILACVLLGYINRSQISRAARDITQQLQSYVRSAIGSDKHATTQPAQSVTDQPTHADVGSPAATQTPHD
ncbi:MAG: hypothetical protein ACUVX9_05180 [Anaerolineae bacterium]